jgi:hypothetical protein
VIFEKEEGPYMRPSAGIWATDTKPERKVGTYHQRLDSKPHLMTTRRGRGSEEGRHEEVEEKPWK